MPEQTDIFGGTTPVQAPPPSGRHEQEALFSAPQTIRGQVAMSDERRVIITWRRVPDYPAGDESYTGTALDVDLMGTLTFRRDEDGFLGVAGAGSWRYA